MYKRTSRIASKEGGVGRVEHVESWIDSNTWSNQVNKCLHREQWIAKIRGQVVPGLDR
jgi:hypothetical protein